LIIQHEPDVEYLKTHPNHAHHETIKLLSNGDEKGECECGLIKLYPRVYWDSTHHIYEDKNWKPRTPLTNTFVS
jgi:hypothetical protein